MTEALKLGNLAMLAREKAARLEGELSARRRWLGWFGAPKPLVLWCARRAEAQCS